MAMNHRWGEKPYCSLDWYLKQRYGTKIYKVALDAGFTCPNRDGTIGFGGCIFCSGGSGEFAGNRCNTITEQIESGIKGLEKFHAGGYIAYYQAYTNTYGTLEYLKAVYEPSFSHPQVKIVSIATRPDCLGNEILDEIASYRDKKDIWVELGLQTIHEKTAVLIRRGYSLPVFEEAVRALQSRGIDVIVHVILGLPGEKTEDIIETIHYLNRLGIQGIKLQLLHVIRQTDLAVLYEQGAFSVYSMDEYVDLVCRCIGELSPEIVIHRLTGDGPSDKLIAPLWSTKKLQVLNEIHHRLKIQGITQGCFWGEKASV